MSAVAEAEPAVATPPPAGRPKLGPLTELLLGLESGGHVSATGVSWADYQRLLTVRDDHRCGVRLLYDNGRLELMSVGSRHERWKTAIARLLGILAVGWRLPLVGAGNVTLQRESLRKGVEPDECFYVQHAAQVEAVLDRDLDFDTDPPPDLAVEVEISRGAAGKLPLYAALGVPEVWRWDGDSLTVLHLNPAGGYAEATTSLAFPRLPPAVFASYLTRVGSVGETALCRELLAWAEAARSAPPPPETA